MAIHAYNLTSSDVLPEIPMDTRAIGASTEPVSTSDIDGWIDDAASEFSGALKKAGIDGSDLSDEAEAQIQRGIKAYAVAKTLSAVGHTGSDYESAREDYETALSRYTDAPQLLDHDSGTRVESNVDTDRDTSEFQGTDYGW